MFIYIFLLVLLFAFRKSLSKEALVIIFMLLSAVCGLREYYVGEDTERYMEYYGYVSLTEGYMEVLWNMASYRAKLLHLNAYGFNLVISFITMLLVTIVCYKETKYPVLCLFFYYAFGFYIMMFNGMRQFLAISIVLVSFAFLGKRKYILSSAFIIFASLFHASSLIAFAAFFERYYRFSKKTIVLFTLLALALGMLLPEGLFISVAGRYAHDITENYGFRDSASALLYAGIFNAFFFLILDKLSNEDLENFWVRMFCLSMLVFNVVSKLAMGPRIMYYFTIVEVVALALLIQNKKNKKLEIYCYLFALVNFIRFMLPEFMKWGIRGSMLPYGFNFNIFM